MLICDIDLLCYCFDVLECYGVLLVVDDFGIGFFNLYYFNWFLVGCLKIDCSFV